MATKGGPLDDAAREQLGRLVRKVWVDYCYEIGDDKFSHLASWEELSESDREVDRRIAEAIVHAVLDQMLPSGMKEYIHLGFGED